VKPEIRDVIGESKESLFGSASFGRKTFGRHNVWSIWPTHRLVEKHLANTVFLVGKHLSETLFGPKIFDQQNV